MRPAVPLDRASGRGSRRARFAVLSLMVALLTAGAEVAVLTTAEPARAATIGDVVPAPVSAQPASGTVYTLPAEAGIFTEAGSAQAADVGSYLAGILRPSTGYPLPVSAAGTGAPAAGISLLLTGADATVGQQGYQLDVTSASVVIRARTATGLFNGVQTLRQLLPAEVESTTVRPGPWTVPGGRIVDYPRFAYRGTMLDVARHFHPVATVKRYIDRIALYKINYLHLHLSDDQGWRIVVDAWPRLATYGGSTQVGGGAGGYYTKAQYQDIVAYAAQRQITIVPEIDMPGHTNAALASYAELNCNGVAPALYTGTDVGFSSLCTSKETTYAFVQNVLGELAAMTPGPYLHIGGDEASATSASQYATFMNRVQPLVAATGKTVMGWHQIGASAVQHSPGRVTQYWGLTTSDSLVSGAVSKGAKVVMSPADKAYLDMKYTSSTTPGQNWAGYIEVQTAYEWNPGTYLSGVPESAVLGVEAPLWTETVVTEDHIEKMAFPRLPAIAELGWSPWSTHNWAAFRQRLGAQGPRWTVMGIDFYRSPQVPWATGDQGTVRYEAENAVISRGVAESNHAGFSGTGFVNYDNAAGSYVQWTVNAAAAGPVTLRLRYANGTSTGRPMDISVNGTTAAAGVAFNGTGAWTTWQTRTLTVNLNAGTNTIRATATTSGGGPNVDYIEIQR
ncbi:family 20 glycosylhydrolase [Planotetraspora phitsanulokensis]|uniref:beta-N-acetylhexosaminidase n=1 Tax=Planotetraspora phitsanulokensis TaxID=575192 RepID=A0A8J3U712_9ACTN|nr:family 20 glycosylhydrolase [Planotetraspora phitsanulokensis]GII39296.1 beta-N-acetylhexosaminidase [Planotetraspora phitsanulokensis]